MSDWLTGGPSHVNLNREIKTHLGIRNPITGKVNLTFRTLLSKSPESVL
jgi:hypothetical protein